MPLSAMDPPAPRLDSLAVSRIVAGNSQKFFADGLTGAAVGELRRQFTERHGDASAGHVTSPHRVRPLVPRRTRHDHQRPAPQTDQHRHSRPAVVGETQHRVRQQVQRHQPLAPQPPVVQMGVNGRAPLWPVLQVAQLHRNESGQTGVARKSVDDRSTVQREAGKRAHSNFPLLEVHLRTEILMKTQHTEVRRRISE